MNDNKNEPKATNNLKATNESSSTSDVEKQKAIYEAFKKKQRNQYIILAIVMLIYIAIKMEFHPQWLSAPILVGMVSASVIFSFINWRCPSCKRYLGRSLWGPKYCKNCGTRLKK